MPDKKLVSGKIVQQGILPLYFNADEAVSIEVLKAIYRAGIRAVEYTNRGEAALNNFKKLIEVKNKEMPDMFLGVGTIKTLQQAENYSNAGADFLVSPVFDSSICDVAYINKVPWIPGVMTPTEIHVAQQAGCNLVKVFPGNLLQPGFVEAVLRLFSGIDFIVTGGVDATEQSIRAWFKSGVAAVGIGGKLITKEILEQQNFEKLKNDAIEITNIIRSVRNK